MHTNSLSQGQMVALAPHSSVPDVRVGGRALGEACSCLAKTEADWGQNLIDCVVASL